MAHQRVGYIRVSSQGQNTARQLAGIHLDKEFVDMVTGSNKDREGLKECMDYVREGDTLVIDSIDRLARNLQDLQEIVKSLVGKGVSVSFIKENLNFNGTKEDPMAMLMFQMMGAFAEFERTLIQSRRKEGIAIAKKAGKHLGRPIKLNSEFVKTVYEKRRAYPKQSIYSLAKEMGVSRASIYNSLKKAALSEVYV